MAKQKPAIITLVETAKCKLRARNIFKALAVAGKATCRNADALAPPPRSTSIIPFIMDWQQCPMSALQMEPLCGKKLALIMLSLVLLLDSQTPSAHRWGTVTHTCTKTGLPLTRHISKVVKVEKVVQQLLFLYRSCSGSLWPTVKRSMLKKSSFYFNIRFLSQFVHKTDRGKDNSSDCNHATSFSPFSSPLTSSIIASCELELWFFLPNFNPTHA